MLLVGGVGSERAAREREREREEFCLHHVKAQGKDDCVTRRRAPHQEHNYKRHAGTLTVDIQHPEL
jgi:hypothetical protein